MAVCEHCGNEYDKILSGHQGRQDPQFRQFRVRHPCTCAIMRSLRRQDHGPRPGERRHVLLLRPLRRSQRGAGFARSDLVGPSCGTRVSVQEPLFALPS
jgi:hypothetical protein